MCLYIETKAPNVYPGMEEKLIDTLQKYDLVDKGHIILQSFSEEVCVNLKHSHRKFRWFNVLKEHARW